MNISTKVVYTDKLSPQEESAIVALNQECFVDVDPKESEENFIAKEFAFIFAYDDTNIIGRIALYKRIVFFAGREIKLGGMGGVCVTKKARHHGVASQMLKEGLKDLHNQGCDIACLNVDLEKKIYGVYEKIGFRLMNRPITFENVHGKIISEQGTMFVRINSNELYELVMNSTETFHYGRGYW